MEMMQAMPTFASLLLFCIHFTSILAQSPAPAPAPPVPVPAPPAPILIPPAAAPAPTGPTNITAILEKAGGFSAFIRLLKSTQSADRINMQLNKSEQGLTIFAPDDSAFAKLKAGSLNSYSNEQQSQLIQSHVLPSFMSVQQFQTASNPLSTQAGGTNYGQFPLNVTTSAASVNLTTGFASASVVGTVYTDNQLAVYQVDRVLLPQRFFVAPPPSPPPAPAPAPSKPKKAQSTAKPVESSGAISLIHEGLLQASYAFALLAASWLIG
ncbi:fasciclin-like arabinogalactan protein 12 [Coffea eugenioides]|uniref:Fasciclin-like arabinogalactan protein 11 n=1 Tax=Coffea arabica TaxID=13443 RepID=A0A6P6SWK9_COFAR|nr:fasciclin-like arabinogalactan protein 12 [Coffea eugenioides]